MIVIATSVDVAVNYFIAIETKEYNVCFSFCRAMLCKRGICRHAVSVCLSVCLSVTFEKSVKTSNRRLSLNFFSPSGSHTKWHHYSFSIPKVMAIFRRGPLYDGGGVGKTRDSEPITWLRRALSRLRPPGVINTMPPGRGKLWYLSLIVIAAKLVDGGRRRRHVYDKKSQRYTKDNRTTFNLYAVINL